MQKRKSAAISDLDDLYSASLYEIILRIVRHEMIAEDEMQDCFIKVWDTFLLYNNSTEERLLTSFSA